MPDPTRIPPARRADLILSAPGADGRQVVKDPLTGQFYHLGAEEAFLLEQLDGRRSAAEVRAAYQQRFGEAIEDEDLDGFIEVAWASRFLQPPQQHPAPGTAPAAPAAPAKPARWSFQSLLYWRFRFFDPDRMLNWIEPRIRFVWTRGFAVVSLLAILGALVEAIANGAELVNYLPSALRWETLVLGWITLLLATMLHEFAHGLTCKHYGGEVHEVGFLFMFGLPCFYCNVSDAWLFPEKYKRLLVTFAGGYFDLCVWAVAVFVWRLSSPESGMHYVAYVLLTVCGSRIFFNFNPFLKLDGYYLLSDWMEIPNLRQRGLDGVMAWTRCLFWGGSRPDPEPRPLFVLSYGLTTWLMSVFYLGLMTLGMFHVFGTTAGLPGRVFALAFGAYLGRSMFLDFFGGDFVTMFRKRPLRVAIWVLILVAVACVMIFVDVEDRRAAPFHVRPVARAELRSRVSGFVREVHYDEGAFVPEGAPVVLLEIPDLDSKIAGKKAEVRESKARLRLIEAGPRGEELAESRAKVARAKKWLDQAEEDLKRARGALKADLARLDKQLAMNQAELEYARYAYERDQKLYAQDVLPRDQYRDKKKNLEVRESMLAQVKAEKAAREARGVLEAETELSRREKELADARGTLTILEAGSRSEEIDAERAKLARMQEELHALEAQRARLAVVCPVAGTVITPRVKEKIGQYLKEGDPICIVDSTQALEIEVTFDEQDVERIHPGAIVELKARAFPFRTFHGEVARVAPAARRDQLGEPGKAPAPGASPSRPDAPGLMTVYVTVEDGADLRAGMTGNARVRCGRRRIGAIALERAMRLVRTDYWW
jgi:multidrug resistance efflux pump